MEGALGTYATGVQFGVVGPGPYLQGTNRSRYPEWSPREENPQPLPAGPAIAQNKAGAVALDQVPGKRLTCACAC